jgi:hypothetical protein
MKIFAVIFCHLLALHASAFTLTLIPKDSTHQFGMGIVIPAKPSKVTIIFLHGIGERGDGSIPALRKFTSWGGINLKNDPQSFFAAADHFGINIICIQTAHNFEYGEIPYAVRFAIDSLHSDGRQIHLLTFSLGGYGAAREFGKDPELPKLFASMAFVVMGPGTIATTAENMANSKVPVWFFTSSDDTKSGTHPDVTRKLYNDIKTKGGNTWLTEWTSGGHLVLGRVCSTWYTPEGQPGHGVIATPANALGMNKPAGPVYRWMFNNRKGKRVKSPAGPFKQNRR